VIYRSEYGLPNVLLLKPLSMRDWYRAVDAIDYIEETYLRPGNAEPQMNHVEVLEHGIYPFSAAYMDKRTGERLPHEIMWWIRAQSSTREAAAAGEEPPLTSEHLDHLARALKFENAAEANENVRPVVPEEIRDLAEFGELFTSPDVVLQLRPLLYVYWS
jgi:hypothetical protein